MKNNLLFLLLFLPFLGKAQQYSAEVRPEWWAFQETPGSEWEGELFADLRSYGEIIPDNPSLTYEWYYRFPGWNYWVLFNTHYHVTPREGILTNSYRDYYVKIYQNSVLLDTSDVYRITTPTAAKNVTMHMTTSSGSSASEARVHFWAWPRDWHPDKIIPPDGIRPLRLNYEGGEVLNVRPDVLSSPVERYEKWERSEGTQVFTNHANFYIISASNSVTARYMSFNTTATVSCFLMDDRNYNTIHYFDPWLINYFDNPYGLRNRGLDTTGGFVAYASPLNPNSNPSGRVQNIRECSWGRIHNTCLRFQAIGFGHRSQASTV